MIDSKVLAMKELLRRDNVPDNSDMYRNRNSSTTKKMSSEPQDDPSSGAKPRAVLSSNTGLGGFGGG